MGIRVPGRYDDGYFTGDKAESLDGSANVADRSVKKNFPDFPFPVVDINDGYVFTSPVGKFRPNPFGLCDMTGNVWGVVADYYDAKYYNIGDKKDPVNREKVEARVLRGGSWGDGPRYCRSACRNGRRARRPLRLLRLPRRPVPGTDLHYALCYRALPRRFPTLAHSTRQRPRSP